MKRRNTDANLRTLERMVLAGDLSAVTELARAYERTERHRVLEGPMTLEEILTTRDANWRISGIVRVNLGAIINTDGEGFLNILSDKLTGTEFLGDVRYRVVAVDHPDEHTDDLLIMVSGDASAVVENEEATAVPEDDDPFYMERDDAASPRYQPRRRTRQELDSEEELEIHPDGWSLLYDEDGWQVWYRSASGDVRVQRIVDQQPVPLLPGQHPADQRYTGGRWEVRETYNVGPKPPASNRRR